MLQILVYVRTQIWTIYIYMHADFCKGVFVDVGKAGSFLTVGRGGPLREECCLSVTPGRILLLLRVANRFTQGK